MDTPANAAPSSRKKKKLTPIFLLLLPPLLRKGSCTTGAKLTLTITSPSFVGLKSLQKHKLVNAVLKPYLDSEELHAVTMKVEGC